MKKDLMAPDNNAWAVIIAETAAPSAVTPNLRISFIKKMAPFAMSLHSLRMGLSMLFSSKKFEMIWPNTTSYMAYMVKLKAVRDWPMRQNVSNSMCHRSLKGIDAESENPVASFIDLALPYPATIFRGHIFTGKTKLVSFHVFHYITPRWFADRSSSEKKS